MPTFGYECILHIIELINRALPATELINRTLRSIELINDSMSVIAI